MSYLNTKPLIYGFEIGRMKDKVELLIDYPSKVARLLLNNKADVGLIPISVLPMLKEKYIISDYCIGTKNEVASVCLFSDVPMDEIKKVLLDYQSVTSVALLQILLKQHWKISPELFTGVKGYEEGIRGSTAGLVIGDRALKLRKDSKYIYDLGIGWKEMTGLPFVFAAWVANKKLPPDFPESFNKTTGEGVKKINKVIGLTTFKDYDLHTYYTVNIDYKLDRLKMEAIDLFLSLLSNG